MAVDAITEGKGRTIGGPLMPVLSSPPIAPGVANHGGEAVRVIVAKRVLLMVATVVLLAGTSLPQEAGKPVLKLRGFALNLTGVGTGRSGELEIWIERWSGDDERERLRKALDDKGVAGLATALTAVSPRVGYVRTQRGGTLDLKFAREVPLADGGRRVLLATDRLAAPKDGTNPRADVYDFLAVEVRLDKDGKGEGRTAGPERLRYNKEAGTLELDRYGVEPVWVKELRVVPAK